jgi:hypothetical protein
MDVSSVKTTPVQPTQPPKRPVEAKQEPTQEAKPKAPEVKKSAEAKPAPVVNTQGHTTGRLLNVTA